MGKRIDNNQFASGLPLTGEYWVIANRRGEDRAVLIGERHNNDLARYCCYTDVLTGRIDDIGFYTDEQHRRIKFQLANEMQALAWVSR